MLSTFAFSQQIPDTTYVDEWENPLYDVGDGPTIAIDAAHNNFHTMESGFYAFAQVARAGGFNVVSNTELFSEASLLNIDILVIANPVHELNVGNWQRPIHGAFSSDEIEAVYSWVQRGGRLILVADHMPFAGAAKGLAQAFGVEYVDGFATMGGRFGDVFQTFDGEQPRQVYRPFLNLEDSLRMRTFTGSPIVPNAEFHPILVMGEGSLYVPEVAWQFDTLNEQSDLAGHWQGCWGMVGEGACVFLGEAASLTSQKVGPDQFQVGFTSPRTEGNRAFIQDMLTVMDPNQREVLMVLNRLRKLELALPNEDMETILDIYDEDAEICYMRSDWCNEGSVEEYWSNSIGYVGSWYLDANKYRVISDDEIWLTGRSLLGRDGEWYRVYFLTIWKLENDGKWRITKDYFNQDRGPVDEAFLAE